MESIIGEKGQFYLEEKKLLYLSSTFSILIKLLSGSKLIPVSVIDSNRAMIKISKTNKSLRELFLSLL